MVVIPNPLAVDPLPSFLQLLVRVDRDEDGADGGVHVGVFLVPVAQNLHIDKDEVFAEGRRGTTAVGSIIVLFSGGAKQNKREARGPVGGMRESTPHEMARGSGGTHPVVQATTSQNMCQYVKDGSCLRECRRSWSLATKLLQHLSKARTARDECTRFAARTNMKYEILYRLSSFPFGANT